MKKRELEEQFGITKEEILKDLATCYESREISTLASKEVFLGKAAFGIFGDGKELPQVVMARFFQKGDFRSGYYRDQTFMFAIDGMKPQQLFSQLYAHADIKHEPVSAGRLMTGHFGTRMLNKDGTFRNLTSLYNSSTDISPTAAQMPRALGIAQASSLYRKNHKLHNSTQFSINGNEISWATIGNASTSEGMFFETINAAGVLQVPLLVSVWDDNFGISVPSELQTTKGDISKILKGFQRSKKDNGYEIVKVKGHDYVALLEAYSYASKICREEHIPVIVHVTELTQPQGHSTSGSHKRYKTKERLEWEQENDCLKKFTEWAVENNFVSIEEVKDIIKNAKESTKENKNKAWKNYRDSIQVDLENAETLIQQIANVVPIKEKIEQILINCKSEDYIIRKHVVHAVKEIIRLTHPYPCQERDNLLTWYKNIKKLNHERYSSSLHNSFDDSALNIKGIKAEYSQESKKVDGSQILQHFFDKVFEKDERIFTFGEDTGKIGDVNQGMAGMQAKYGELRVQDTGIRECTILGQAIGTAMRGLRPIAEIQYVDYLMYAIQIISDDLATLHYRSAGQQKAPVIIRTRGHRLQGVWHSGSPLGTILNAIRGVYICVPRNMVQAAGMYNTLLKGSDPGLVIECLNAYRQKEVLPDNIGEYTAPLGEVEILREGTDITIVTYGAMCQVCLDGADKLAQFGIQAEIIDVRTLLPFDLSNDIVKSISKTNKVLFADEDVPGGATAYMLQKVIEKEDAYYYLDSKPRTIHSYAHRPAYAMDGDYFSKPNADDVFDYVYEMMNESNPEEFKKMYW